MVNNRDLLKEAIADAKTVKETAIANAKSALEEAFSPYLKEKLAAKLSEMDNEDAMEEAEMKTDEAKKQGYNDKLDDAEGAKHGKKKQDMKQRRADSENMEKADGKRKFAGDSKMKEELREAYATVKTLKSELNEINLLNAKLLYTNKIFKSKNLTEAQKVKVLESFDKATTVKEAKLVFETVNSGLKSKKTYVNENLGRASKSAGMAVRKTAKQPIVESDEMVKRFQKLAGIL